MLLKNIRTAPTLGFRRMQIQHSLGQPGTRKLFGFQMELTINGNSRHLKVHGLCSIVWLCSQVQALSDTLMLLH